MQSEKVAQGEAKNGVRILVLIPAENRDLINTVSEGGGIRIVVDTCLLKKYADIYPTIDFYKVTGEKKTGEKTPRLYKIGNDGNCPPSEKTVEDIVNGGYSLGIAFGDRLTRWINEDPNLTPEKAKAKFPFLLIATASISKIKKPHLRAYPNEETVGMLLARLMDKAADREKVQSNEWCALFVVESEKKSGAGNATNREDGCRKAFEDKLIEFGWDSSACPVKDRVIGFPGDHVKGFLECHRTDRLFCVYAASALDDTAYCEVVRAINGLGSEEDKKILVTDACWNVPDDCNNLKVAQLSRVMPYLHGAGSRKIVGKELFEWLIVVLLKLSLKTFKLNLELKNADKGEGIADCLMTYGPLMVTDGETFSFIKREMFIPFSCYFWTGEAVTPEKTRSVGEACEAISLAMSRVESAADEFKHKRTGRLKNKGGVAENEHLDSATKDFAEKFETQVLKACFAAEGVFFIDDKREHEGVRRAMSERAFGTNIKMPDVIARKVAEESKIIQVAYNGRNIENTEAVQLYCVQSDGKFGDPILNPITLSLIELLHGEESPEKVVDAGDFGLFYSRNEQRAKDNLKKREKGKRKPVSVKGDFIGKIADANKKAYAWEHPNASGPKGRYPYDYLYYVPTYNWDDTGKTPAVAFFTDVKFCDSELSALKMVVTRFYSSLYTEDRVRTVKNYSIRSAIGAIMSRNGSHNIGSHVLASLSYHVGTCPDDRTMYQYIQHRMDYIAMATTDFPNWRQPMQLVGELLKMFLSQRHLLDGIAKSEGLKAYQFQNVASSENESKTIRLHARRISRQDGRTDALASEVWIAKADEKNGLDPKEDTYFRSYDANCHADKGWIVTDFIDYNQQGVANGLCFANDVDVAIAGGEVGQHAFFTIVENILRNAAKHSWVSKKENKRSLDLYLDFQDRPENGDVECIIWADFPVKKGEEEELYKKLADKIGQKLVEQDGQLKRENLGLAEMRIAAGFLNGKGVRCIGGQEGARECLDLICPVDVQNGGGHCLGYRFTMPKPRELLILTNEDLSTRYEKGEYENVLKALQRHGVWIRSWNAFLVGKDSAFSYVVLDGGIGRAVAPKLGRMALALRRLPFRTICEGDGSIWNGCFGRHVSHVPEADGIIGPAGASLAAEIDNVLNGKSKNDPGTVAGKLLERVYRMWITTLRKESRRKAANDGWETKPLPVVVDVANAGEARSGAGKGLVGESGLTDYALKHTFNSVFDSYLNMAGADVSKDAKEAFRILRKLDTAREIEDFPAEERSGATVEDKIVRHVIKWSRKCNDSEFELVSGLWCMGDGNKPRPTAELKKFIGFFEKVVLIQMKAILSGYRENIATLPIGFGAGGVAGDCTGARIPWEGVAEVRFTSSDAQRAEYLKDNACLAFCRHLAFDERGGEYDRYGNVLYAEPLSGSQSYLNTLASLGGRAGDLQTKDYRLLAKMLECGLLRVLIIDERMKKFGEEHKDIKRTFKHIGVDILNDDDSDVKDLFKSYADRMKGVQAQTVEPDLGILKDYEIVIIHMGIIDKLLEGHEKSKAVGEFVDYLQQRLRYVVVTTGRGDPPNLPPEARVLPFSVVEGTMSSRYPEKMILVDNVMNVLPRRRGESL